MYITVYTGLVEVTAKVSGVTGVVSAFYVSGCCAW
jgi:hypothetical protein